MNRTFSERGGIWVILQSAIMILVLVCGPLFPGVAALSLPGWTLFGIGAIVGITGTLRLGGNRTPFPRPNEDSQLVTSGVYSIMRHPLYSCLILLGAGWSMIWSSSVAGFATVLMTLFFDRKARREEVWLFEKFPDYASYARRVRRFLPWIY